MIRREDFKVSVVIPVYNAEEFLERAVERVLEQPEVAEIVLFEDGSPDDSLRVAMDLQRRFDKVSVYTHPNNENRGAGETRNAGVSRSKCEFVAFADADNFYLPNRFQNDREIFDGDPEVDGVYNAQGIHYADEAARKQFVDSGLGGGEFLSVSGRVPPEEFLWVILGMHPRVQMLGGLGIDAITLRRRCFQKAGFFEPRLRLHQDVHFFVRLAASCRMAPGRLESPVALRGVHGKMRSTNRQRMDHFRRMRWALLSEWFDAADLSLDRKRVFKEAYHSFLLTNSRVPWMHLALSALTNWRGFCVPYGSFDQGFRHCFGGGHAVDRILGIKNRVLGRPMEPANYSKWTSKDG